MTYGERALTLYGWQRVTGIDHNTLRHRLELGWTVERTMSTPPAPVSLGIVVTEGGQAAPLATLSRRAKINKGTVLHRVRRGLTVDEALSQPTRKYERVPPEMLAEAARNGVSAKLVYRRRDAGRDLGRAVSTPPVRR